MFKNLFAYLSTEYFNKQNKRHLHYFFEEDFDKLKLELKTLKIDYCIVDPSGKIENIGVLQNGGVVICKDYYSHYYWGSQNSNFYTFWNYLLSMILQDDRNCQIEINTDFCGQIFSKTFLHFDLSKNLHFVKLVPDSKFKYNIFGNALVPR